jgi:hypothetical protein
MSFEASAPIQHSPAGLPVHAPTAGWLQAPIAQPDAQVVSLNV